MIVAIDGPAAAGKSTTARRAAERLGFLYLDTGAMYRAVAWAFLERGMEPQEAEPPVFLSALRIDVAHEKGEMRVWLDGKDVTAHLRTPRVSAMTGRVSKLPDVRGKLVAEQRRIARACVGRDGGVVLDGRDIGTVVFPKADVKIFLVADLDVRAERRLKELAGEGSLEAIRDDLATRDQQDAERALAPLRRPADAIPLDTSHLTIDQQVDFVVDRVRERLKS